MGVQSIKIPVELELRQLQGSIQTLKNALEKVKPGTKVYENLSKSLDKIEHQFYSLENASKKSFKNVGEINAFEKAFEKVANSISDVASDFKRLNFEDLSSDLFSKDDIQRIQEASNKIKKVQTDIDNLRSDKFKEVASSSDEIKKAFSNLEIDIDTTNIDDAIKSIKNNLKSLSSQIGGKTRSINSKKNQLNLLETQAAAISSLKTGGGLTLAQKFGANFFDDTGKAFKDENSKQALVEMLAGLGLNKANLIKVQQSTAADLENFSDNIINTLKASAAKMQQDIDKIKNTELPSLDFDKQQLVAAKANQDAALKQLNAIDPSLTAELDNYRQQLSEAKNQLALLKQELAQVRNGTDNYTKVVDDNNNALRQVRGSLENVKEQASNVARAQEKLADIKFAIKNWFGFNQVINLTKNAVRNMITQIRELDDVMTQIAIVTDMTQKELWAQMDTYSSMAQQYGVSIKGVYEVSQLYYQQGLQTAEVMNLTEETLKMAKIANLDYAEATDYMTVALRGFKLEMSDAQQVTDVYSALAAATASDTEELAVAMSKTASSAEAVGSSFESTSAMIATMISITREAPENIGSALKSIISRYGEMTSDPMKLVDSEGEEMSLNKVDKALQSVGISLQNAQGQFRDFDDVILELSKTWDTIDTNAQRYIATVMAGNRQQSRFLALVGNYEEYAKALEVAENAEDAGTLQTLKTMDSISTKWEQLKVSLQEFYTSAGLEDIFKGVLDALNAFLTKANDIPKLFGKIPVSVIALVSSLITSIKNVATSLTIAATGPIKEFNKKLDELKNRPPLEVEIKTKAESPEATNQTLNQIQQRINQNGPIVQGQNKKLNKEDLENNILSSNNNIKNLRKQIDTINKSDKLTLQQKEQYTNKLNGFIGQNEIALKNYKKQLEELQKQEVSMPKTSWIDKVRNSSTGNFLAKYAGSISLVTSALSALALTMKDTSSAVVEGSKTISGGLNTIGGLALGIFGGQWQYAIPMLISGIPTLLDGLIYETEEKLKNATEKATELSNTALQSKSDYRTLKNEVSELETLTSARYDSAEAMQEYLDYSNQMADKYPELIDYIDSEGNAVIDLSDKYGVLEAKRLAAAEAAAKSAMAELEVAKLGEQKENEDYYKNLSGKIVTEQERLRFDVFIPTEEISTEISKTFSESFKNVLGENAEKFTETQISDLESYFKASETIFNEHLQALLNRYAIEDKDAGDISRELREETPAGEIAGIQASVELNKKISEELDSQEVEIAQPIRDFLKNTLSLDTNDEEAVRKFSQDLLKEQSSLAELTKATEDGSYLLGIKTRNFINSLLEIIPDIKADQRAIKLAETQTKAAENNARNTQIYWENQALLSGKDKSNYRVLDEMTSANKIIDSYLEKQQGDLDFDSYLTEGSFTGDYENIVERISGLWNNLITFGKQDEFNDIISNLKSYSENSLAKALQDIGVTNQADIDLVTDIWNQDYSEAYNNFLSARGEQNKKLFETSGDRVIGGATLDELAPKYYASILEQFAFINSQVEENIINSRQGQNYGRILTSLWEQAETDLELGDLLQQADLTSLTGIYSFRKAVEDAGKLTTEMDLSLKEMANNISINVVTESETFISTLTTSFKEFGDIISKAGEGMDLEEALKVAEKLDMSIADFKFEDGEFKMEGSENFQKLYDAYVGENNELQKQLKTEIINEITRLQTLKERGMATQSDLESLESLQILSRSLDTIVADYNKQLLQTFLLQNKSYQEYFNNLFADKQISETDTNELIAAARQGEQEFRNLLAQKGLDMTNASIEAFMGTIEGTYDDIISIINEGKGLVSLAEFDWSPEDSLDTSDSQAVQKFYQELFAGNHEKFNEAWIGYLENQEIKASAAIADIASGLDSIDIGAIGELANSLNTEITNILGYFHLQGDGSYTSSENEIRALMQQFNIQTTAEIEDALKEYLNNIISIVANGIEGSMTNVEFESLNDFFDGRLALEFTETAEGLKLTKASAIEVYTELKKIDSIQAQIAFSDLAESLEEAGSGYEDVASTMKTIAELNEEIADVPVDSKRREELERELDVAKEILRVRSQDPDSFNFMGKDLPDALKGPENYWNSVGEAYKVMNEASQSGYMEIQDYVNIVRQMEAMATAAGQDFSIGGMNAAALIQKGFSSLSNVDGEGVKIAMEGVGIDFANAATDMGLNFDDGIKEMAKSQIKMLDAAIRMLEAMVAMENIDANSDGLLDFGEIFKEGTKESGWDEDVVEWADNLEDAAGRITIGGKSLLDALMTLEPEQIKKALNQLMSIDWTLGDTDIASQIQNVLSAYFPDVDITQGKSVFDILEVPDDADKNAEHFTKWLDKFDLNVKEYNQIKKALDLNSQISTENNIFKNIEKMLGLEEGDNRFENLYSNLKDLGYGIQDAIKIWDEITVTDEDGKTTYTYNGTDYTDLNSALAARRMSEKSGEKISDVTTEAEGRVITAKGTVQAGETTIEVLELKTGSLVYLDSQGQGHSTLREAIDSNVKSQISQEGVSEVEAYAQYGIDITADKLSKVSVSGIKEVLSSDAIGKAITDAKGGAFSITIDGQAIEFEAGTTEEQVRQKLMEAIGIDAAQVETIVTAISTAISTADWSPVGKAISEALTGKVKTEGGVAEGIEIGELILKPAGLKVDASEAGEPTLLNAGEDLTAIPVDSVTLKPINVDIDTSEFSLSESVTSGLTISIPENLNADSVDLINQFNSAISAAAANATVNSGITITITGLDGDQVSNIENYNKAVGNMPSGTTTSEVEGIVSISAIDLLHIMQLKNAVQQLKDDPNVNSTIIATAEGNAIAVIQDILAVYGYDGKTAELIFNALDNNTIDDIITELDEVVGKDITITANLEDSEAQEAIEDLVKPETKLVTIQYTNPTGVGPETDTSTIGYEVYGYDNLNGNFSRVGRYDNAEQTIDAVTAAVSIGTFQDGNFEITEIKADGTTATITATSVDLISGAVSLGGSGGDSTPKTQTSGTDSSSGNAGGGNIGAFDLSGLTAQIQAVSSEANIAATNISSTASALSSIDTSPIDTAKTKITSLANASRNVSSSGASRINAISAAIRNIPSGKTISISYSISVSVSASGPNVTGATGRIIGGSGISSFGKNSASGSLAKGNYSGKALASGRRKTLMGELGPELVVSGGRYFLVGQNGAEFVDLADDAIVFNHLQTAKLIKHGRAGTGKPITNETNAVSFATGNIDGPAMASAASALAQLRQIRAMWQALLDASLSDLGSKAGLGGKGGGGGGGGGAGNADDSAISYDLEKWYNWLRKIAQLEQEITLEQAKRENMTNGADRAKSLSRELDLIKEQLAVEKELVNEQYEYYKKRAEEVNNSIYGKVFSFDEKGLMQFKEGEGYGLDLLEKIKSEEKATSQLNAIKDIFKLKDTDYLLYDENGQKVDTKDMSNEEIAKVKVENFFNNMDATKEELEELYDSVYDHQIKAEELQTRLLEIEQERIDHQLELEQTIYDTLVDIKERQIKNAEDYRDTIQEASKEYLEGLNKALDNELKMYNANQEFSETSKLQNRLAILQRSGGSASEIKALQEQIDSRLKDAYFQEQQDQIDAIQAASDAEIERLDTQISLMEDTLAYERENGLIWDEVSEWMGKSIEEIVDLYTKNNEDYLSKSELGKEEAEKEFTTQVQQQKETERLQRVENNASEYVSGQISNAPENVKISDIDKAKAEQAYKDAYEKTEGSEAEKKAAAEAAAKAIIDEVILKGTTTEKPSEGDGKKDEDETSSGLQAKIKGGKMNLRKKASSSKSSTILDTIRDGQSLEVVGYNGRWLKVENAGKNKLSGYMKYSGYEKYYSGLTKEDLKKIPGFSKGGLVDFTGLAMVHGSKSRPESFISAEHTKLLKESIFSKHNNSIKELDELFSKYKESMKNINNENDSSINIESVNISVHTDAISNGYDARRAGQEIFDEMVRISRKTGNVKLSRR